MFRNLCAKAKRFRMLAKAVAAVVLKLVLLEKKLMS
jgi:hypothetical protein